MASEFRITAQTPDGPVTISRPTGPEALAKARELIANGVQVTVTCPDGSNHSVACLSRVNCSEQVG